MNGIQTSIDTIELSDAFRRHASFNNQEAVENLVRETRDFVGNLTYYRPEEGVNFSYNKEVEKSLKGRLKRIAGLARELDADVVHLPIYPDRRNTAYVVVNRLLKDMDLPVHVSFQLWRYDKDLSSRGAIDPEIKTVLDEGYRGFANINRKLFNMWTPR